jgi:hypothetical protein
MGISGRAETERLEKEYAGVQLGDFRLEQRLRSMVRAFSGDPARSFPGAFRDKAGIEGGYRFLRNRKVTLAKLLEPHLERTRERAEKVSRVLVLHDTTEVRFKGDAERVGLHRQGQQQGFLGHVALAISDDGNRRPLGVIGIETLTHDGNADERERELGRTAARRSPERESQRWRRVYRQAKASLSGCEGILHVMDREGDFYEMLSEMIQDGSRFVVRNLHDRQLAQGAEKLRETAISAAVRVRREVRLSRRRESTMPKEKKGHPARETRAATLAIGATRVCIPRTAFAERSLPETIDLNVVVVREENPPQGMEPIVWFLLTNEPVETVEQIEAVVDAYRSRWVVEEFFKALKTGCALEDRQLESSQTILNALGFLLPMAWDLLCIRTLAQENPTAPASELFSPERLRVLRAVYRQELGRKLPPRLTAARAMMAIAHLGGYLENKGRRPGWQILARGLADFLRQERGWVLNELQSLAPARRS